MTFETHTFEHRGYQHAYEIHGEGDQLFVYLHGLLMDRQMNRALAHTLAEAGHRVALVDFLGHGESDKPRHASSYRMDAYADDVLAFLDHLGADQAVVGGVSLGADVSLHLAVAAPERVRGLVIEMPVLEWAVPAAALLFTPMLLTMHYAARPAGWLMGQVARFPRTANDSLNSVLAVFSGSPDVIKAVLHGVLTGPVAPTVEERRNIEAPALVIAHTRDLIHPFSDAESLTNMLPKGRLAPARSMTELRLRPARLTAQILDFVDEVWADGPTLSDVAR
ncbi:MAG: alpha/beta fold hydrolase [Acidimicrobiales bacterium]